MENGDLITVTINGRKLEATPGEMILTVCERNGIDVPTLCHFAEVADIGACRLCVVEVQGGRGPTTACTTPVTDGMSVQTETPKLLQIRRSIVELLFAERNHVCPFCVKSGDCELQTLAYRFGIDHIRYKYMQPRLDIDASNPKFVIDHNRCVLCRRCVRVCSEKAHVGTLGMRNRGAATMIVADLNEKLAESTCNSCAMCIPSCPTGALYERASAYSLRTQKVPTFSASLPPPEPGTPRVKIASEWLAGCSGCHMSLLDLDETLVALTQYVEITSSPVTDLKHPPDVTVGLIEGAVSNSANEDVVREMRRHAQVLIALGDCACLGGVAAMRNLVDRDAALRRAYVETPSVVDGAIPSDPELARVSEEVVPIDRVVPVDAYVPGCPPSPEAIFTALSELLGGRMPKLPANILRFD